MTYDTHQAQRRSAHSQIVLQRFFGPMFSLFLGHRLAPNGQFA